MTAKPSPLPWMRDGAHLIRDANGDLIEFGSHQLDLLVRSVNAHEKLVEALTELMREVLDEDHEPNDWSTNVCIKEARAALKLARGEA